MNPQNFKTYTWSSLPEYLGKRRDVLVHAHQADAMTPQQYERFLDEYIDQKELLKKIKDQLAL